MCTNVCVCAFIFNWQRLSVSLHMERNICNFSVMLYFVFTIQYTQTALQFASANGHLDIVKLLIDRGSDANSRDGVSLLLSVCTMYVRIHVSSCCQSIVCVCSVT